MRLIAIALWTAASLPSAVAADTRFDAIDAAVESLRAEHGLDGAVLVLAQDGAIVHQRGYGNYTLQTRVPIASASKWLSAALVARLVDQGRLRWDDALSTHWPDAPPDKRAITLRQLFSMTSGIPGGDLTGAAPCLADRNTTLAECAQQILALPLTAAPGSVMDYGGNAMQVGGHLVERATGESWNALFRQELATPLGLVDTHYSFFPDIDSANPRIAGGVFATAPDYMKLLLMWQARGKSGGRRLLDSATINAMDRDQTVGTTVLSSPMPGAGYGIGHWVEQKDANGHSVLVSSPGAFGFTPWIDLRRGISGVLLVYGNYATLRGDIVALVAQVQQLLDKDITTVPFADFSGIWWRAQESGSGYNLVQRADHQLTGTIYTFDDAGAPLWLVIGSGGAGWTSSSRWQGRLYRSSYSGSGALSEGVDRTRVTTSEFGTIVIDFSDATHAQLQLQFPQATRTLAIERFPF